MSQGFKLKYDQLRENDPTHRKGSAEEGAKAYEQFYNEESHARNLCFVWPDGRRKFLNYSYLVSGEYSPDASSITLAFTTDVFVLKGVNLESLFYEIMDHLAKQVICTDARYNVIEEDQKFVVNEIQVMKSG